MLTDLLVAVPVAVAAERPPTSDPAKGASERSERSEQLTPDRAPPCCEAGATLSWTSERADMPFRLRASEEGSGSQAPASASGASNIHGASGHAFGLRA